MLDLRCGLFHVGHCKGAHHLWRWWNLIQFQIIEQSTWKCWQLRCWLELVHWVFVEDHLVWFLAWVCQKGRINHRYENYIWTHGVKRRLIESISAFLLNDIEFWHYGEWLHSQEIDWFEIWDPSMIWLKGRRWRHWLLFAWCCQWLNHNNWKKHIILDSAWVEQDLIFCWL